MAVELTIFDIDLDENTRNILDRNGLAIVSSIVHLVKYDPERIIILPSLGSKKIGKLLSCLKDLNLISNYDIEILKSKSRKYLQGEIDV